MQTWHMDILSMMSVTFVVTLASLLPVQLAAILLACEVAFGAIAAPLRYRQLSVPSSRHSSSSSNNGHANGSASSGGPSEEDMAWLASGLKVLRHLLDPSEAHAGLLRSDGGKWFEGWWSGQQASQLGRRNVAEFLSYTLFARRLGDLQSSSSSTSAPNSTSAQSSSSSTSSSSSAASWSAPSLSEDASPAGEGNTAAARLLCKASEDFISALGLDIGMDHNPDASFVAHTEEPLHASYRPLTFYLLTEAVAAWGHAKLTRGLGFGLMARTSIASYYLKPAATPVGSNTSGGAGKTQQPPIVFLHGIGLGLAPYTLFLEGLAKQHPGRALVAVQYKHVSMRLTSYIPTATEVADDVAAFLTAQGLSSASIVAHSYGTLVASSLTKRHPQLVAGGLTLIDPVCFAMFLPHLVRKTLHFEGRQAAAAPTCVSRPGQAAATARATAIEPKGFMERWLPLRSLMKGLVVREIHCSAAMCRNFHWADVNLWTSELPPNTTVVLGGRDGMIPVKEVKELLTSPAASARGVHVLYTPQHAHGAFLMDAQLQTRIIAAVGSGGAHSPLSAAPRPSQANAKVQRAGPGAAEAHPKFVRQVAPQRSAAAGHGGLDATQIQPYPPSRLVPQGLEKAPRGMLVNCASLDTRIPAGQTVVVRLVRKGPHMPASRVCASSCRRAFHAVSCRPGL